jgi:hypothetical protein
MDFAGIGLGVLAVLMVIYLSRRTDEIIRAEDRRAKEMIKEVSSNIAALIEAGNKRHEEILADIRRGDQEIQKMYQETQKRHEEAQKEAQRREEEAQRRHEEAQRRHEEAERRAQNILIEMKREFQEAMLKMSEIIAQVAKKG